MNKKFSTLVGGLALLSTLTAGATVFGPNVTLAPGNVVKKLPATDKGLYQLGNGIGAVDSVVYMSNDGVLQFVPTPINSDSLANTLWCVTVTASEKAGQNPTFDFINKGTNLRLDITMAGLEGLEELTFPQKGDSLKVGGEISGWAFSKTYVNSLEDEKPLYSYFMTDSVVGLARQVNNGKAYLYGVKAGAQKVDAAPFIKLTLQTAPEIVLNAKQINTLFGMQTADKGVNLKFMSGVKEVTKNNPFNNKDKKFFVNQVAATSGAGDSLKYVYVLRADSSFLRVDTSYANTVGHGYLAYDWTNVKDANNKAYAVDSLKNMSKDLKSRHQFLFTYRPSVDSVNIYVHRAIFKKKEAKSWTAANDTIGFTNARVFAQDLGSEMVLTVDSLDQNVHISMNYTGCTPADNNNVSVANGLYIIKNAKGQVLAAPIHKNAEGDSNYEWVTLDAQDAQRMPAYQWVVTKNQDATTELAKRSPIAMLNREFPGTTYSSLQLTATGEGDTIATIGGVKVSGLKFAQITDSAYIKDATLGYKQLKSSDLLVEKYKFNYLHPFADTKWIGRSENAKDSALYVQDAMGAFSLKEGNSQKPYGVTVNAALLKKIPGLAQLTRTQYVIVLGRDTLVEAAELKYAVGTVNYEQTKVDSFYFKANNYYNEKDYYAILVAHHKNIIEDVNATHKVGTADDGKTAVLKVQELAESRTSAFSVEPVNAPLYRRFDNVALEGNEGDASDTLRFVEEYRGEVLQIEGNKNFKVPGVDFLGIYTEAAAPSGLSFIVDTAWVKRGLGYIKPQYLISIERDDVKGKPATPCTEAGPHVDKDGNITADPTLCVHGTQATPDMQFGKYLVNFADSVAAGKMITKDKGYNWKEYDRAGFVKAIRYGDSLYILKDQFANVTKKDIDLALLKQIKEADSTMIAKGKDEDGKLNYIKNLTGDNHKYVTWSMRYTKPGTESKNFLVESMKKAADKDIAPEYAAWLKMQNGCLVLSDKATSSFNEMTGGDDALIFDVKHIANDQVATDNETITTSSVSVVAGEGFVTVYGAQGKKIVVSDVLGKTTTVIATSDSETISATQGLAIIAVEGEAAVKAMVK